MDKLALICIQKDGGGVFTLHIFQGQPHTLSQSQMMDSHLASPVVAHPTLREEAHLHYKKQEKRLIFRRKGGSAFSRHLTILGQGCPSQETAEEAI